MLCHLLQSSNRCHRTRIASEGIGAITGSRREPKLTSVAWGTERPERLAVRWPNAMEMGVNLAVEETSSIWVLDVGLQRVVGIPWFRMKTPRSERRVDAGLHTS